MGRALCPAQAPEVETEDRNEDIMTTLTDILQQPDIRALRQAVYDAHEAWGRDGQYATSLALSAHQELPSRDGWPTNRTMQSQRTLETAQERYRTAQYRYHAAINEACAAAGLPPYVTDDAGQPVEADFLQSVREAAMWLGVTADTIRQQIHNGAIAGEKRDGQWHIRRSEVLRYQRESRGRKGPRASTENL